MRKLSVLIFSFFLIFTIKAQQTKFCVKGSEWHYRFNFLGFGSTSGSIYNEKIKYVRDTIITNDTVKIIEHSRSFIECNPTSYIQTLIKQKHDTIFFRNQFVDTITNPNNWEILYVFSDTASQFWKTKIILNASTTLNYTTKVNSVSTITVNAMPLKRLNVTCIMKRNNVYVMTYSAYITERYGCEGFMFNFFNRALGFCDADYFTGFLCYQDSTFGLKQFTSTPCNYQYIAGLSELKISNDQLKIYPNPTNSVINVEILIFNNNPYKIKIINTLGQIIQTTNIQNQKTTLNISALQNGIYFLQVFDAEKLIGTQKIIKE